ncbi:sensor histidine kinase [Ornithinicoccus hortensis]|uniref:Sensor-like histidine kinase SenX3 n=1 Tax=Ornithinicoccus hortensis TaxID=82346 RepID=A0A542YP12_9MICO|nr:ATP-binding protein [Ornithinicoccus hortensis]TQL49838.1 two-component system sensor histidine kinase SenX3 [Ornithinicoccus hortensis]
MTPLTAAALGVTAGLLLGALALVLVRVSERSRDLGDDAEATPPAVSPGVADVLAVLRSGAVVLEGAGGRVLKSSSSAVSLGLVRGEDLRHPELRELVRQVAGDGVIRETELELPRGPLGHGRLVVSIRVAPLSGGLLLILVDDRTQAHRVEEVRRDFVVNVSHELKTPVGGIALLAEAIEDAADDPVAVTRFAGRMKSETTRLSHLVQEIVELSRLQAPDKDQQMVVVDVPECARLAVEQTRLVAQSRTITLSAADGDGDLRVYGDKELLVTAIRNLVANAINYSDDRTRVTVVVRRAPDGIVEVGVSDQGTGISREDQERIFERFYRVDAARSRSTGGTGLGLSIVKHICANHGGDVVVWSKEGHGSTFTIRLPAVEDHRAAGAKAPPESQRPVLPTLGRSDVARVAEHSDAGDGSVPLPTAGPGRVGSESASTGREVIR